MNNEIKCPKCGEIFQADENYYAEIVKQVKDKEFSKELKNRELQFEKDNNAKSGSKGDYIYSLCLYL